MKSFVIGFVLLFGSIISLAQKSDISGKVIGENNNPLGYASIALLYPSDSTLAAYGITNEHGQFKVKQVADGEYIMQIAYLGHETYYKNLKLPYKNGGAMGVIAMKPAAINLPSVDVESEYIPIKINEDTIEYNAAAFRTKPDASTEDLLRKLPGVEVDRAGNIKAVGEDVSKVLVEGKEFFSGDSKVATKNLPADAIKKVQVYDKTSDESDLSGVDDGYRDKTINLVLKDDKKQAWFGDVKVGYGTDNHYAGNANIYRFSPNHQFAVLSMINNINKFGFSFQDYLDFNGGFQSMMSGGSISLSFDNSMPIDYGQTVTGFVTSGAGGLNYSYEKKKDNRFYISYLGSAYKEELIEDSESMNFSPLGTFNQNDALERNETNFMHPVNFGWKNKSDSINHYVITGGFRLVNNNVTSISNTRSFNNDTLLNILNSQLTDYSDKLNSNFSGSWLHKGSGRIKLFKLSANASGSNSFQKNKYYNSTEYLSPVSIIYTNQYQDKTKDLYNVELQSSALISCGKKLYLEPGASGGAVIENFMRTQGDIGDEVLVIDSLSPEFERSYYYVRPGISFKRNTNKTKLILGSDVEIGRMSNELYGLEQTNETFYLLPQFSYEYKYKTGHRINLFYASNVIKPVASQLLPVVNMLSPLNLYYGNRNLKPEYRHDASLQWLLFDQFSGISVFAGINGAYTKDKIAWSRKIDESFNQIFHLTNVRDDYSMNSMLDFSSPVRKSYIKIAISLREDINKGISYINGVENISLGYRHKVKFSVENFNKKKWDVQTGISYEINDNRYSINESMNYTYNNLSYFGEIRYTPNDKWHFMVSADVMNYNTGSFEDVLSVPLLNAEVNYNFLKNNRGMLSLVCFDILNKNTGIERTAYENYLMETRSNIIGRYFMISFKYRLSKFKRDGGVTISV